VSRLRRGRSGGVLLEILLSLAIFVAAGTLVLSIMTDATRAASRAESLAAAVDCARSLVAEVEAGIRSLADLRGEIDDLPAPWERFRVEGRTVRSDFRGLVLVEVRVHEIDAPLDAAPRFVLRQLVPVRPGGAAGEAGDGDETLDDAFDDLFDTADGWGDR
jgi:hypothetical protein